MSPARLASSARAAALHEGAGLRDLRPHRVGVLRERDGSGVMRARLLGVARFLRGRATRETAGSAAGAAARCRNCRRGSFIVASPSPATSFDHLVGAVLCLRRKNHN